MPVRGSSRDLRRNRWTRNDRHDAGTHKSFPRQLPGCPTLAAGRESERPGMGLAAAPATVSTLFVPLDPGIINEVIPAFFIGRNMEGFSVARDANGQIGGIFLLENSALSFARRNSRAAGCATIYPSERFELDLENKGNPSGWWP